MAAYILKDLSDIVRSVMAELKIPLSDTVELARVKSDINEIYINEVAPYKEWKWLRKNVRLEHKPYYGNGTASVTPDSTTVTLSVAPSVGVGSKAGFFFATDNFTEIYYISSHTAGSASIVLSSPFTGTVNSAAKFKIWKDFVNLPTNCRETTAVLHRFFTKEMEGVGLHEFRRIVNENSRVQGHPCYYTTDDFVDPSTTGDDETEADRYRILRVHPSLNTVSTTLEIDYIQDVTALELDGDEPLMAISDRSILKLGALSLAWSRQRNPEEAQRNWQLFQNKLMRMAGDVEDSFDTPQIVPKSRYMLQKRGSRLGYSHNSVGATGGGSYTSPTYIANANIATGNTLTGNLAVDPLITIDGRDISVDGAALDLITQLPAGQIIVGDLANMAAPVDMSGDATIDNLGVLTITPLVIDNADISLTAGILRSKIIQGTAYRILTNNSIGFMSENAALTPTRVVIADANGQLADSAVSETELTTLTSSEPLTSVTLTDNTSSAANVATWTLASFDSINIEYSLKRGSSNKEVGRIHICTDGTNAAIAQGSIANLGTLGVTFTVDVNAGSLRLRYTTTSTGTNVTFKYKVSKWLA